MGVALIGCGYWGSKIKQYVSGFFDLKYVADSKFNKDIIWNDKEVESVIVATPIKTHYEVVKEALENNKHVFSEKPITVDYCQALELEQIAKDNNVRIGVDYIQTFSPSIKYIQENIGLIGEVEYIEMSTKHLGRFMDLDVYWLLASHHLSVLDMFMDLDRLDFVFEDHIYHNGICTTGSLVFSKGRIDVSTNFPGKEMTINFYGKKGTIKYNPLERSSLRVTLYNKKYRSLPDELIEIDTHPHFNEQDNLIYAMIYFRNLVEEKVDSNIKTAIKITRILADRE